MEPREAWYKIQASTSPLLSFAREMIPSPVSRPPIVCRSGVTTYAPGPVLPSGPPDLRVCRSGVKSNTAGTKTSVCVVQCQDLRVSRSGVKTDQTCPNPKRYECPQRVLPPKPRRARRTSVAAAVLVTGASPKGISRFGRPLPRRARCPPSLRPSWPPSRQPIVKDRPVGASHVARALCACPFFS